VITPELREKLKELVARPEVRYVLGYEEHPGGLRARALFARTPEEIDRLSF